MEIGKLLVYILLGSIGLTFVATAVPTALEAIGAITIDDPITQLMLQFTGVAFVLGVMVYFLRGAGVKIKL